MLKLGMNIRKMQERHSNIICDNNDSKVLRLLSACFVKKKEVRHYNMTVVYEMGHYRTIKDEYQNLVPTSELISAKLDSKGDNFEKAAFLYLKHYHDYGRLVGLLAKMNERKKESQNIEEYLS